MSDSTFSEQDQRSQMKPIPPSENIAPFLELHWGLKVCKIKQIESYDDANFYCETQQVGSDCIVPYLVKFYNAFDTIKPDFLYGLSHMLDAINQRVASGIEVPSIISPCSGGDPTGINFVFFLDCPLINGKSSKVAVRVFKWITGTTLSRITPTFKQMFQLGHSIAEVTKALSGFDHPAFHRIHLWDLKQLDMSMPLLHYVDNAEVQECIRRVHHTFHSSILPISDQLPCSIIMADCNDANVLVSEDTSCDVSGLIDFSDAVHTWRVNEIAISMAYALLTSYGRINPYESLGSLFCGYVSLQRLTEAELGCLVTLILVRLSISVMVGACSISKEPENDYLKLHAIPGRDAIIFLSSVDPAEHRKYFKTLQDNVSDTSPLELLPESEVILLCKNLCEEAVKKCYNNAN